MLVAGQLELIMLIQDREMKNLCWAINSTQMVYMVGCVAQLAERRSLAGEMTLSCAQHAADG